MNSYRLFVYFIFIGIFPIYSQGQIYERTDTLYISDASGIPVIDGSSADEGWQETEWMSVGEVWMPYNNLASNLNQEEGLQLWEDENDFSGRYKVIWSPETNLLYVLAEIKDNSFVDGYIYNENPSGGGGYPNYDILEVFIDEDRSGGLHVFDGSGSVADKWGSNAENAFSYHLAVDAPNDGEVQQAFHALDIAGTKWGYPSQIVADYAGHFPEFAVKKEGNLYTWEFSLEVHGPDYNQSNPESSVVSLEQGKVMGLSLAYCDNDNPEESPLKRDHFFGSVYVPSSAYNDHWKNADWFNVAKLSSNPATSSSVLQLEEHVGMNSYVSSGRLNISIDASRAGRVNVRVLNILGREMFRKTLHKTSGAWSEREDVSGWQSGIYLVEMIFGNKKVTQKIVVR